MLTFAFFLATIAVILQGVLVPRVAILAFAPFLALVTLRCELNRALWLAAFSGALIDLVSDDPIGLHALNYVLVTAVMFRFRRQFSHDQPFHLSVCAASISFLSTCLQLILLFLFDRRVPFNGKWIFADLIGMPVIDALYAFVWFAAPLYWGEIIRNKWVVFWLRKKNRSPISH